MTNYKIPKRYLGAFKCGHRVASKDFIDDEYAYSLLARVESSNGEDKEAVEALEWLTKFNNEYYKNFIKKGDPNAIHKEQPVKGQFKTDRWGNPKLDKDGNKIPLTMRGSCYNREHARNADAMSLNPKQVDRYPKLKRQEQNLSPEEAIIEYLDGEDKKGA